MNLRQVTESLALGQRIEKSERRLRLLAALSAPLIVIAIEHQYLVRLESLERQAIADFLSERHERVAA